MPEPTAGNDNGGGPGARQPEPRPETYPAVRQDDAIERTGRTQEVVGEGRAFARDGQDTTPSPDPDVPPSTNEGRLGPEGDPAEGKR